jgi:shikimate dehydrogenase
MCERLENEKNIVLVGYMGSGKSTVSKILSDRLSYEKLDTDSLIEDTYETSITDIFASKGEGAFRDMETKLLKALGNEKHDGLVLATGGGLPLREINRRLLSKLGRVVYLRTSPQAVYDRIKHDTTRPLLQVEDPKSRIKEMLDERAGFYEMAADVIVDTDGKSKIVIADEIIKALGLDN